MTELSFGLAPALVTPFEPEGGIAYARLAAHAGSCLAAGCSGVTLFGTTGEGPSLAAAERERTFDELAAAGISPAKWVVSVFATSAAEALAQVGAAAGRGVPTVLLAPPFYFPAPSDEALYRWYASVIEQAGAGDLRFLLYNIPAMTQVSLSPGLANRLRASLGPAVRGLKDSSASWATSRAFLEECPELEILIGDERDLAKGRRLGLAGAISGVANLAPARLLRLLASGEEDAELNAVVDALVALPVIPSIKYAMELRHGGGWRRVRPPLGELPDQPADHVALVESL